MGDIVIVFCPTLEMIADMHTKPKTGKAFVLLWNKATGNVTIESIENSTNSTVPSVTVLNDEDQE
jgi:hypothetical protein